MSLKKHSHKILIIENEMIIAADLFIQLTALNFNVIGIHIRAEDALKTIEINRPDLILMDINLAGEMDGVEAATYILKTSKIPVIFISANNDYASYQRVIASKPLAFVAKPFLKANLERSLKFALNHIEQEKNIKKNMNIL